jgi:hypothetical protein
MGAAITATETNRAPANGHAQTHRIVCFILFTCAFALAVESHANGLVAVWGQNDFGQARLPEGVNNIKAIAAGAYHCLALKTDGTVIAWGSLGRPASWEIQRDNQCARRFVQCYRHHRRGRSKPRSKIQRNQLSAPRRLPDNSFVFFFGDVDGNPLQPGDLYGFEVQAITNLTDWIAVFGERTLTNGLVRFRDADVASFPHRFYRVLEP